MEQSTADLDATWRSVVDDLQPNQRAWLRACGGVFRELHATLGITLVMVTHTRQLVSYGTRSTEMAEGQIVNGSPLSRSDGRSS